MIIGVDIDEVLLDTMVPLLEWHNKKYGTNFKKREIFSYNLEDIWGGSREEAINKYHEFYKSEYFRGVLPINGSQKAIEKLSKDNGLITISSRPKIIYEETVLLLGKYFQNKFQGFYFTDQWSKDKRSSEKKKSDFCLEFNVDYMIDDSLNYVRECINAGIKTIIFNQPWNENEEILGASRGIGWDNTLKIICNNI